MSAPQLTVQVNGGPAVTGDQLNTYVQWCETVADLRGFIGVDQMTVYLQGTNTPDDGGQGNFYWNASGTAPDDNGATTVIPSGSVAGSGEWTRLGVAGVNLPTLNVIGDATIGGTLEIVGALTAVDPSINGTVITGPPLTKINVQKFTTNGTYTPTTGMQFAIIEVIGGGGGGGGATGGSGLGAGAGGGAGAYSRGHFTAETISSSQIITIGAAGTGGAAAGGAGGGGGASSAGSLINANGGAGGDGGSNNTGSGLFNIAGGGGGSPGTGGDFNCAGAPGDSAVWSSGSGSSGTGGSTFFGGGGAGLGAGANGSNGAGSYGGGGGGAIGAPANSASYSGGVGFAGIVVVTEYISA